MGLGNGCLYIQDIGGIVINMLKKLFKSRSFNSGWVMILRIRINGYVSIVVMVRVNILCEGQVYGLCENL